MYKITLEIKMNKQKGFTLIELLVVIAIIGLLSSIVLVAMSNSRSKGRDARRVGDMTQMGTALELYYNTNKGYPDALAGVPQGMTPSFLTKIPAAPVPGDGVCDTSTNGAGQPANSYYYATAGTSSLINGLTVWSDYNFYFCIGNQTGNFQAGVKTLTPKGIR